MLSFVVIALLLLIGLAQSQNFFCPTFTEDEIPGLNLGVQEISAPEFESCFPHLLTAAQLESGEQLLYIVERRGIILWFSETREEFGTLLDFRDRVFGETGEYGLLGVALHPEFPEEPYLFLHYSRELSGQPIQTYISRVTLEENGESYVEDSELQIFSTPQPQVNHNGGSINFGPDGLLYIILGDGGFNPLDAQDLNLPLGKILRINVTDPTPTEPFIIPADNPFFASPDEITRMIYAQGFRNPFRWSFDGDRFWIGDVGQVTWEEVDAISIADASGANFGWPTNEGSCMLMGNCTFNYTEPVFVYPHENASFAPNGFAIIGGHVYRGAGIPQLQGHYIAADFSGIVYAIEFNNITAPEQGVAACRLLHNFGIGIAGLGVDTQNELYVTHSDSGRIFRFANFSADTPEADLFPEALESNADSAFCAGEEGGESDRDVRLGVGLGLGLAILLVPAVVGVFAYFKRQYDDYNKLHTEELDSEEIDLPEVQKK